MTARPHHIHPRDWARMSWHQQARAHRAWVKALEAERCPARVEPVIVGPYSRVDADHDHLSLDQARTLRAIIAGLAQLDTLHDSGLAPHGTRAARERHKRHGEPACPACAVRPRRVVTDDDAADMWELHLRGLSHREIGERVGWGATAVKNHLRQIRNSHHQERAAAA